MPGRQDAPSIGSLSPWPVRDRGLILALYEYYVGIAFFVLFFGLWAAARHGGGAKRVQRRAVAAWQAAISVSRDTTTGPQDSTATALTEVCAAPMDRDALRRWLANRPEITQRLLRVLARRLRRTDDRLSDLASIFRE